MLERDSLSKQVYSQMKKMIILQETPNLRMGEKINEAAIAKMFDCSVTPVRESINMLRGDGLIVGDSYRSSSIVRFTRKDVKDYFELRECLELYALRKAFSEFGNETMKGLQLAQKKYREAYMRFDQCAIIEANKMFHNELIRLAGNNALTEEFEALSDRISMMRAPIAQHRYQKSMGNEAMILVPVKEHDIILMCIEERNLRGAEDALANHLTRIKEDAYPWYE